VESKSVLCEINRETLKLYESFCVCSTSFPSGEGSLITSDAMYLSNWADKNHGLKQFEFYYHVIFVIKEYFTSASR